MRPKVDPHSHHDGPRNFLLGRLAEKTVHQRQAKLDRRAGEPTWNFNKYLVSADGKIVQHFDSEVAPDSPELTTAIERLLN